MRDPVWIVSYPRSGSTWLRFLLAYVLHPERSDISWHEIEEIVPDAAQRVFSKARIVKSHGVYEEWYNKVIYLYRDGRDVALSYFYYLQGTWEKKKSRVHCTWDEFFDNFIHSDVPDGSWKAHVRLWMMMAHGIPCLSISYESLLKDGVTGLKEVCKFAGVKVTTEMCEYAVMRASFGKIVEQAERNGQHPYSRGLQGTSGRWKDVFTPKQAKRFWKWAGDVMAPLGYSKEA